MDTKRSVVLYGASGFSGRLVAEFLREYNVPFIAAGRNKARIQDVMNHVPGIETADYEIAEVGGSVDELSDLFRGSKVVCNTVGPFIYHGPQVLEAASNAGCHYLDISGEQAWIRQVAEKWSAKFAAKGLLAAPGTAFMSAVSDAAARLCLESGAVDTLETLTMFKGIPTFGSTQTIFAVIQTDGCYLEQNQYKPWPRATRYDAAVPGYIQTNLCSRGVDFRNLFGSRIIRRWQMCDPLADFSTDKLWRGLRQPRKCSRSKFARCPKKNESVSSRKWRVPYKAARRPERMHANNARLTLWLDAAAPISCSVSSSALAATGKLV